VDNRHYSNGLPGS